MQNSQDGGRDFDIEVGYPRRIRRRKSLTGLQRMAYIVRRYQKLPAPFVVCASLSASALLFVLVFMYNEAFGTKFVKTRTTSQIFTDHVSPYKNLDSLVMVAGHAIYTSSKCDKPEGEESWFLEPYQKHPGQASSFVEHIKAGVEVADKIGNSLLLFSGGETRKDAGPRSEAQSYWSVAESKGWFGKGSSVRGRTLTEEYARDSFENLLFSICRFRELTGQYPANITVVSYDFKKQRFSDMHRRALRFPASQFSFVGVPTSPTSQVAAIQGELKVQEMFQKDPYGCRGDLRSKRMYRDPFLRTVPYPVGCPEIRGLFGYCGSDAYSANLPWDH